MGRYLLDTNILVFLLSGNEDNISLETIDIITDYNNQLYTSSISVTELLQLYRIKKIKLPKYKSATELYQAIESEYFVKVIPFAKEHVNTLSKLVIAEGHNDPFDHSIISQAITEKLILISSDRQFAHYTKQKLNFIYNKR